MSKSTSNKKKLSPEQSSELLKTLKTRFEKNMNRHKGLEWAKVLAKLEAKPEKLWSLDDMEVTGGEPDVIGYDKKRMNTFSLIVQRKVLKTAEVFVTTEKHLIPGKKINQRIMLLIWQPTWALKF